MEVDAKFISEGRDLDMMKEKFSFLTRVLQVTITSLNQTLYSGSVGTITTGIRRAGP